MATITGPVTGGKHGFAFSLGIDVPAGYVLEEFFVDGTAAGYALAPEAEYTTDGRWRPEQNRSAPFRTRIMVLRPTEPDRFSGIVVASWQNVTVGFDMGAPPVDIAPLGLAWVGVTAQKVAVDGFPAMQQLALRGWDAERYESLEHPGDDFSFDIFAQAVQLVSPDRARHLKGGDDPLGGLPVVRLVGAGVSQSALRLRTFVNAMAPVEHQFDGFFLSLDIGSGALLDTTESDLSVALRIPNAQARIREDLDVPVLIVNSESEVLRMFAVRQPDSDRFRLWEIAGAPHISSTPVTDEMRSQLEQHGIPASALPRSDAEDVSVLAFEPVQRAALRHLLRWIVDGKPPPSFDRVDVDDGDPPSIRRDADGNASGGVRLPELSVPLATHFGIRPDEADILKRISGSSHLFTTEQLRSHYAGAADYLALYTRAVDAAIAGGILVPEDREPLIQSAAEAAGKAMTW